jgi:hypothetical protein
MSEERTNCLEPSGSVEWWLTGWTRLYDKMTQDPALRDPESDGLHKRNYVFGRMAGVVVFAEH